MVAPVFQHENRNIITSACGRLEKTQIQSTATSGHTSCGLSRRAVRFGIIDRAQRNIDLITKHAMFKTLSGITEIHQVRRLFGRVADKIVEKRSNADENGNFSEYLNVCKVETPISLTKGDNCVFL